MAVTVMLCSRPVSRSLALTLTMPSTEIEKVTSTSTCPRGARRKPLRMNSPSISFSAALSLSPWSTRIFTEVWLSRTVVKTWPARVGIVVFCSMRRWK